VGTSSLVSRDFQRILLIKPSAVGDVIHSLPVLAKLRARYPAARIDWLLTPALADLVGGHPALSNVVVFDRNRFARVWRVRNVARGLAGLWTDLRRPRYDLVVDLQGQFRSALLTLATGSPVRIGFDRPRSQAVRASRRLVADAYRHGWTGAREGAWLAYTHRIPIPTLDVHAVDRYLWLGRLLGFDAGPPIFHVPATAGAESRVARLVEGHGMVGKPLAVLAPGTLWQTKQWRYEGFAEVARWLHRGGRAVVLAGAAAERERCRAVAELCPQACDLSGQTTLADLASLIRRADVCVTNDSGSMHLAVALNRPVVGVFGPTDPMWTGPYGRPDAVVRTAVPCAPCYLRRLSACPHEHACMKEVSGAAVIERVQQALAVGERAAG
jgi:lipopolysaccharide heptosyltransferase I